LPGLAISQVFSVLRRRFAVTNQIAEISDGMKGKLKIETQTSRIWPWLLLTAVLLGIVLFIVWVWFAVQGVKRIKASTDQTRNSLSPKSVEALKR
jgi:H+/Cl- antiporter ClcA